ncbi:deoxynucleoside triphosphate triphosphohydrolase SAMHD1-like [Labeo rohita]|uniref:Deoxynucleoside triphosphate triphosphohydrolase SAMHD1-like n=1 Tax=Labeo rohita TaxID=84645 RepID=A0A498L4U5_LABRO|nr:deoxynucleoside triphosphate triphosphohydrolase SAMHD1-like [Labeo rohita]
MANKSTSSCFFFLGLPDDIPENWKHEQMSVLMFDDIVKSLKAENEDVLKEHGLDDKDVTFIKELIEGAKTSEASKWSYEGRDEEKSFLYEIVANKQNGIDVDKWDYFARDCHHLGIRNSFDHLRLLKFARVCKVNKRNHICFRDKEADNVYDMFRTRYTLHRQAYQHKIANIVEDMLSEALLLADRDLHQDKPEDMLKISEAIKTAEDYSKLTDEIFEQILSSTSPNLEKARDVLVKVVKRKLPKFVGEARLTIKKSKEELTETWKAAVQKTSLNVKDLPVYVVDLDHGMKDKNPIEKVYFYSKRKPNEASAIKDYQVQEARMTKVQEAYVPILDLHLRCGQNVLEVSLWRDEALSDLYVGDDVEITHLKAFLKESGKGKLNSSTYTTIKEIIPGSQKQVKKPASACQVSSSALNFDYRAESACVFSRTFNRGGWAVIMCPCGIVYSIKCNLRAESPRDFADLLLSWKHMPNVIIYDFARGLATHMNLRESEKVPISPFEGRLAEPSQLNIELAKSGKLKVSLPWLNTKKAVPDINGHPVTGSSHHYNVKKNNKVLHRLRKTFGSMLATNMYGQAVLGNPCLSPEEPGGTDVVMEDSTQTPTMVTSSGECFGFFKFDNVVYNAPFVPLFHIGKINISSTAVTPATIPPVGGKQKPNKGARRLWSNAEVNGVLKHFKPHIAKGHLASLRECELCKKCEPVLQNRTLQNIRG